MIFRIVLWVIGMLVFVCSRLSPRMRAQSSRNVTICLASKDGVARSYVVENRRARSHSTETPTASCYVLFNSAKQGAHVLLASNCIELIVDGLASGEIELAGDPTNLLWFYEMTMGLLPWNRPRITKMPDAYIAHNPNSKVASRITREPAVSALDPTWENAHRQREKLIMWQVAQGIDVYGKPDPFRRVVKAPVGATEEG